MYLKAVEIQGFKSFPDKTRLAFEKDVTAIVGPNGSGKSNISDAILWVMGEQRSKALRGSKMEDVIFGGTEKRNKLGYAEVSLIIDNSERIIDDDSSEIMITRRYYRSGESEYSINRESVRLKDVNGLLMDTGLGRDGYSIIGQGRIAEIVSTKSTDRREVFEEAAGISRYRYRKEEAERKLEHTADNLLRINDKIDELELQVGPLKSQSEIAKRYLSLRDELRVKEVSVWMESLDRLHSQNGSLIEEYNQAEIALEKAKKALEGMYASSESLAERMHDRDIENEKAHERLSVAELKAADIESAIALLNSNISNKHDSIKRIREDMLRQAERVEAIQQSIADYEKQIADAGTEIEALNKELVSTDNVIAGYDMKIENRSGIISDLKKRRSAFSIEIETAKSKISMLTAMEKSFDGFSGAVKAIMKESSHGAVGGIVGPVASLVRTNPDNALAVETALGAAAQNIVTFTQSDAKSAIEFLKRRDAGRATFLPMDVIKGNVYDASSITDPGFIGTAYELAKFDSVYSDIFAGLLGHVLVADTLSDAVRISNKLGMKFKVVSLDGQVVNAGGSMTGGSSGKNSGFISRANELDALNAACDKNSRKLETINAELSTAEQAFSQLECEREIAAESRNELRLQISNRNASVQALKNSVEQFGNILSGLTRDGESREKAVNDALAEIEGFENDIKARNLHLSEVKEEISKIRESISNIGSQKLELEGFRIKAEKDAQQKNSEIFDLERVRSRLEQKRNSAEMEERQLIDKLWDTYQLSHNAAMSVRQPVESMAKENKAIQALHSSINALGTPNLGAIDEYERVRTRYEFLTDQRSDIEKSKAELEKIIADVTDEMTKIFREQFSLIDEKFRETFHELFGGGKASLELEDEENVLECGIEIKVQPPGKAVSVISLLSGGEMAFVAIALYFAILKVRPTPFCVMDEIEAALDEANVTRFAEYMRRMSQKTQFIVITHRRGTMEEADMLYGVTMQEKGVSSVLELDFEQAQKTAEI